MGKTLLVLLFAYITVAIPRNGGDARNFVDFMKGFLEGVNEKGDIEKLLKCIKEGENIFKKIIDALQKIKTMNPIKIAEGIKELIDAIKEIMGMIKPCMEGFEQLKKLANAIVHADIKKIVTRIMSHPAEFVKCIRHAIEAFAKKDFHGFGKAVGELLRLIFLSAQADPPLVQFMNGFLEGIKEKENIENLLKCIKGGEEIIKEIIEAIQLIKTMNPVKIVQGVKKLLEDIKKLLNMLKPCMEDYEQLQKLEEAIAEAKVTEIVKKIVAHPQEYIRCITEAIDGYNKKNYQKCGLAIGELLYIMFLANMGPSNNLIEFLKGLIRGINDSGDPNKLIGCTTNGDPLLKKFALDFTHIVTMETSKVTLGVRSLLLNSRELHSKLNPCMKTGFDVLPKLLLTMIKSKAPDVVKKILADKENLRQILQTALEAFNKNRFEDFGYSTGLFLARVFL